MTIKEPEEYIAQQNTRVRVNFGRTINRGNYESLRLDVSLEEELNSGDSINDAVRALREACQEMVDYEARQCK